VSLAYNTLSYVYNTALCVFFVCRCLLACRYYSVGPKTCQVVGSFVVFIQQSRPSLYYLFLDFGYEKTTDSVAAKQHSPPHSPVALIQHLLFSYNSCGNTTNTLDSSMVLVDMNSRHTVIFFITGDRILNGFWIPVCQTVLCLRVNFQGWDTSWVGYRPTAWYLYGRNGVEKCEKVQKSATFFWF